MACDSITRAGAKDPWGSEAWASRTAASGNSDALGLRARHGMPTRPGAKADDKPVGEQGMPGAGLTCEVAGQVSADRLALKPYWGKPAVRNFREGDGNVGIIRSPVRAIALPDSTGGAA